MLTSRAVGPDFQSPPPPAVGGFLAPEEASLRGQIEATQRLIGIQTQLLGVLRSQNERGQIGLPDVVAQETAVAQARLLPPLLESNSPRHDIGSRPSRGAFRAKSCRRRSGCDPFDPREGCRSARRQT